MMLKSCRTAASGHDRPDTFSPQRTLNGRLRSETCRMTYFSNSAFPVLQSIQEAAVGQ
jgi:hypothetical protein